MAVRERWKEVLRKGLGNKDLELMKGNFCVTKKKTTTIVKD
jgi:hypothetical protein